MEPNAFPENTYGYGAQLMFSDDGELAAVYLKDDYESWYDADAGIIGSNLSDANLKEVEIPVSYNEYLENYLNEMDEYYTVVHTNNWAACRKFIGDLKLNKQWTVEDAWRTGDVFIWTTERIKERAISEYTDYIEEWGDPQVDEDTQPLKDEDK